MGEGGFLLEWQIRSHPILYFNLNTHSARRVTLKLNRVTALSVLSSRVLKLKELLELLLRENGELVQRWLAHRRRHL